MSSEIVISVKNLTKNYETSAGPLRLLMHYLFPNTFKINKPYSAIHNISCTVNRGDVFGVIGRNGSGKSTLLQVIAGVVTPSSGSVVVDGRISTILELGSGFNPELTGRDNIYLYSAILGQDKNQVEKVISVIINFAEIDDFIDRPVKTYSSGMFVRLAFAVAIHVDADILIIDEALAVGDKYFSQKCMGFLREFSLRGTIIFVTHDSDAVLSFCNKAMWIDKGIVRRLGSAKDVVEDYLAEMFNSKNNSHSQILNKHDLHLTDVRSKFINSSNLRNDIKNFQFDPGSKWFGDKQVCISNVLIQDENSNILSYIVGGELVNIIVDIESEVGKNNIIVGFYIKNSRGENLFGDNTYMSYMDRPICLRSGEIGRVSFQFYMPYLPVGDYTIAVAVASGTQDEHMQHHWIHDCIKLQSISSHVATGLIGYPINNINYQQL
jgi:lipopolysaccharide transport system ATP-binding protein